MSRVAVKSEMIGKRTTKVVEAHGLVTGIASRLRVVRLGHLSRTCATRYRVEVATLQSQGVVPVKGIPAGSGSKLLTPARQRREHSFLAQPITGQGFASNLLCQAPHEGNNHSNHRFPCISSRKAVVAAMADLIRGSQLAS